MKQYNFPEIKKIEIKNFSLFKKIQDISIDVGKKVFCLAGANGIGKSTFVTIINYALTGIVKNPERNFTWYNSIPAFYAKSKSFAANYFDGRVVESDRDLAEVTIHFNVGNAEYKITRGFFEPDELRSFEKSIDGKVLTFPDKMTPNDLNEIYGKNLTKDIGLTEFDQFVFLQIFVFTFDETHQLLFWDNSLIERVLHLFFGLDPNKAKLADQLRKDVSKYDSNAKNIQWDITKARNELKNILDQLKGLKDATPDSDELEIYETHKFLSEELNDLYEASDKIGENIKDTESIIADYSIKISALRSDYDTIFNHANSYDVPIEKNEEIIAILNDLKVKIFTDQDYQPTLDKLILFISELKQKYLGESFNRFRDELKRIDEKLFNLKNEAKSAQERKNRLMIEEKTILLKIAEVKDRISNIEKDNNELIKKLSRPKTEDGLTSLNNSYKEQIDRYEVQKDENRRKRDERKKELETLEKELSKKYTEAESEFIPMFNAYAKSFLGLIIDVQLSITSKAASFKLDINDSQRKESYQLSESQRYFIDIALRMALIEFGAKKCTLIIDTPEGSLDIAYESRAGKMFADFSKKEYNLMLTANINTSRLLLQLAEMCKSTNMLLERMTEWTVLSDVQQQEEPVIEEAFKKIEDALNV